MLEELSQAESALHTKIDELEARKASKKEADSAAAIANEAARVAAEEEAAAYTAAQTAGATVKTLIDQLTLPPAV